MPGAAAGAGAGAVVVTLATDLQGRSSVSSGGLDKTAGAQRLNESRRPSRESVPRNDENDNVNINGNGIKIASKLPLQTQPLHRAWRSQQQGPTLG